LSFSVNNLTIFAKATLGGCCQPATCRRALAKADDQTNDDHDACERQDVSQGPWPEPVHSSEVIEVCLFFEQPG
jgi:hypothetical protein